MTPHPTIPNLRESGEGEIFELDISRPPWYKRNQFGRNLAVLCAFIFVIEHVPSTMAYRSIHGASIVNVVNAGGLPAIIGLYAPLALVCTYFLRKYGLLSAIVIHVISDLTWRVVYGSV